jgi:hypothetical protein
VDKNTNLLNTSFNELACDTSTLVFGGGSPNPNADNELNQNSRSHNSRSRAYGSALSSPDGGYNGHQNPNSSKVQKLLNSLLDMNNNHNSSEPELIERPILTILAPLLCGNSKAFLLATVPEAPLSERQLNETVRVRTEY